MYIFDFRLKIFWSYIDTLGRRGLWRWLQDIYYCGAGDFVWDIVELGVGVNLLGCTGNRDALIFEYWYLFGSKAMNGNV